MVGAILGLLLGGIALATVLTFFIKDRATTTSSVFSTASVTASSQYTVEKPYFSFDHSFALAGTTVTTTTRTTTPPSLNTWNLLGNMSSSRRGHTSTYIPETNTVLIAGGISLATTESVDPATISFTRRGNLTRVRAYHTADRLSSRVVLMAGGSTNAGADIYDPILGVVTATLPMNVPRSRHTSSVIEIGGSKKVLITGGQTPLTDTGEVYDDVTGSFIPVSNNMSSVRWAHTATAIPNGLVIIAGGRNRVGSELDTVELYNATSNTFTLLSARMSMARYEHTATYIPSIQAILFAGGWTSAFGFLQSYDLFDVNTLSFRQLNRSMLRKHEWCASSLLMDERVLMTGGSDGIAFSNTCEIYNPTTNTFTMAANMSFIRGWHSATVLPNTWQVLVCGGSTVGGANSCELYSP